MATQKTRAQLRAAFYADGIQYRDEYFDLVESMSNILDDGPGGGGVTPLLYVALVRQGGTADPIVEAELSNTLGTTFTWSRGGAGEYSINAAAPGTFTLNKTMVFITSGVSNPITNGGIFQWTRASDDNIQIKVYGENAGVMELLDYNSGEPFSIEIRVYP